MATQTDGCRGRRIRKQCIRDVGVLLVSLLPVTAACGQGVLSVTPGRVVSTSAGRGAANASTLASPSAIAYDASGNLYVADTANHTVREVIKATGAVVSVAGSGVAGFAGDAGPATAALLDTPTGVAVDAGGTVYIADSHNHRIRKVAGGVITTVAGTGVAGAAGDGASAVLAQLASPQGVAVDASGTVYIADTGNHRIRRLTGSTLSTLAGTGEQGYTGDGGPALQAALDSPGSVAVDSAGVVYIADRHNQRIRAVSTAGVITTLAGSGAPGFAGGFAGDGASAAGSALSRPTGASVDAAGNLYIADTNNQRVRTVTAGVISTAAGTGEQGLAGDGAALSAAVLSAPKAVAVDASGNLSIADTGNGRIRAAADASLVFGSTAVGVSSATQTVTLANSGTGPLTVSTLTLTGPFAVGTGGSCARTPITLAAGASCTEVLAFTPASAGAAQGLLALSGPGASPQTLALAGTGTQASTAITLTSSAPAPFVNQVVLFTAAVTPTGSGTLTGSTTFYANGVQIGTAQPLANGTASVATSFPVAGTYTVTAVYSGDSNFAGSTGPALAQLVGDFSFTLSADPGQGAATAVLPGAAVAYTLQAAPLSGPFTFPITLSARGLPAGATATFSPATVTLGSSPAKFTMTVQTSSTVAAIHGLQHAMPVLACLLLPFATLWRRRFRGSPALLLLYAALGLGTLLGVTGCGSGSGFYGAQQRTYSIDVVGTATNSQGSTLQRVATVQLTLK